MRKSLLVAALAAACIVQVTAQALAESIILSRTGVIRTSGQSPRNLALVHEFDALAAALMPPGAMPRHATLAELITSEGLVGGPAAGAFFQGAVAGLPAGIFFTSVAGDAPLNSGLAGSTALFADMQGQTLGTSNLYHLGSPAEGSSENNRVQFAPTDVGTNGDNMMVLRPVSFDGAGRAIEVQPGERGVLEAGRFTMHLDPSLQIVGVKITFIDTESAAAANTRITNIRLDGWQTAGQYAIPSGANDNEYFVGFLADEIVTSFDIHLGHINSAQTGGDGVVLDMALIEFIAIPEPGTLVLLAGGCAAAFGRRRSR